jgi:hypothetical protein
MIYHTMSWCGLDVEAEVSPAQKGDQWDPPVPAEVETYTWSIPIEGPWEAFACFNVETLTQLSKAITDDAIVDAILEDLRNP